MLLLDHELDGWPVVCVDEAITRMTGYAPAELVGRPWPTLWSPRPETAELVDGVRHGLAHPVRLLTRRRDGSSFAGEVSLRTAHGAVDPSWLVLQLRELEPSARGVDGHASLRDELTRLLTRASEARARAQRTTDDAASLVLDAQVLHASLRRVRARRRPPPARGRGGAQASSPEAPTPNGRSPTRRARP